MAIGDSAESSRVHSLGPGWIDTPINAAYFTDPAARVLADKRHAIERIGQIESLWRPRWFGAFVILGLRYHGQVTSRSDDYGRFTAELAA